MSGDFHGLGALESAVATIARAQTPSETFRALLEGTSCGAARAAVFLLREHRWKGWGASGYGTAPARALRALSLGEQEGWLARIAATGESWIAADAYDDIPRFGQAPASSAIGLPVRVGGKTVAAVVAERGAEETPWHPEALAVLVHAARLRLEFDLAWRRLRVAGADVAEATPTTPTDSQETSEFAASGATAAEIAPWSEPRTSAPSDPQEDEARRYAKLVATDIRLYNEDAVAQGRLQGDLAHRLGDQLQRGRESFERRFPGLGSQGLSILHESYVQVLAGGDASLIPPD